MTLTERRQSYRVNDNLLFSYRLLYPFEIPSAIAQTQNCTDAEALPFLPITNDQFPITVNIGTHGIAFATEQYFHTDEKVALTLLLSRNAPPLRIVARVVEFLPDPEGNTGYVRLNFEDMAQYSQLRLANYIAHRVGRNKCAGNSYC